LKYSPFLPPFHNAICARLVELNAIEGCINVYKAGVVQRIRAKNLKETGEATPRIHAVVFDPTIGILHKLPVDFKAKMGNLNKIYDLY
jgi:carbonic anhydrase